MTAAVFALIYAHSLIVIATMIGPRSYASYVVPAVVLAAVRADRIAAARPRLHDECRAAVAARLGVGARDGMDLECPACVTGDYGPLDPWTGLELLYRLTGEVPDVVRAVCLDCGAASRATATDVSHYIPDEYRKGQQ